MTIPETNPEMDVYRIGTILELVRALAMSLVEDGKMVKISVQQNLGDGFFQVYLKTFKFKHEMIGDTIVASWSAKDNGYDGLG